MKNNFKNKLVTVIIVSMFMFLPILSFAQVGGGGIIGGSKTEGGGIIGGGAESGKIINPINSTTLEGLIKTILEGVLKIGIPIIALALIYCGFLFVAARGNSEAIGKAKDSLLYTLIGAAILLGSWAIALLITSTVKAL
jgi:hypothetical protein